MGNTTEREIRRQNAMEQLQHDRRMRRIEYRAAQKKKKDMMNWILEFSKKVVVMCVLLHCAVSLFSMYIMYYYVDTTALPTLITQSSDILKTCVFGYMIKAGIENWQKIRNSKQDGTGAAASEPSLDINDTDKEEGVG